VSNHTSRNRTRFTEYLRTTWLSRNDYSHFSHELEKNLTKFIQEHEKENKEYGRIELLEFFDSFLDEFRVLDVTGDILEPCSLSERVKKKYRKKIRDNSFSTETILSYLYNLILRKDFKSLSSKEFYQGKKSRF